MMIMIMMVGQMMSNSIEAQISMIKKRHHSIFTSIPILDSSILVVYPVIHSVLNMMLKVLNFPYLPLVKLSLKNWLFLSFLFRFTSRFSLLDEVNTRNVSQRLKVLSR